MSTASDDDGWVFDSLVNFLHGAIWRLPVMGFIEEKSVVFDPDSYNNMTDEKEEEFRKIHEEYKALVDYMLTSFMEDLQVTPEQVEQSCRLREQNNKAQPESHITRVALEQLWAAEDFNAFRRLMTRKNIDLQLQSLELLVAKYGILSPSLRPANSDEDQDPNGEEDFLQVVIRYTAPENTVFHSSLVTSSKCCPPPIPPSPSPPPLHSFLSSVTAVEPPALVQTTADVECHRHYTVEEPDSISEDNDFQKLNGIPVGCPVQVTLLTPEKNSSSSQILQQDEHTLTTGKLSDSNDATEETTEENNQTPPEEPPPPNVSIDDVKVDEETAAEIASAAPEQHRILTAVRRALDSSTDDGEQLNAPKIELPTVGSEEEIERRREYLRAQRDKLVALKKREREKQLSSYGPNLGKPGSAAGPSGRPKSAKAAQIALKSPEKIAADSSEKTLQARRALAQRLKQELVEN